MKKLLLLFLFAAITATSYGQATFTLVTPPCNNDGVLSAAFGMPGLTPPLTVKWYTTGSTGTIYVHTGVAGVSDVLTGYSGGPINVVATDVYGTTDTGSFAGAAPFTLCAPVVGGAICPLPDTLSISVCSGGTAPFHYSWYNIATSGIVGTMNPIPVASGNIYGVTVTDAAGCTYGSLADPLQIYAYVIPTFGDTVHTTTASCTNGTATAAPTAGGVLPYTFLWSTGATTPSIGSLVMGFYYVTITDAVGCTYTDYGYVDQSIVISAPVISTPTTCAASDGAVIAFGSGGVPPYSYVWNNGATTASQTGIPGGLYDVNVTDANGCIGSGANYVGTSTPISVTYTTTPSLCTSATGSATLAPVGGTMPYSVMWYTTPPQTGTTATSLISGTYYFKVTDAMGCKQSGTVYVPPIDVISASFLATPATCTLSNGNLTVYPTGGVLPYTFAWSTSGTGPTISSKPSGAYSVVITDNLGCKLTKSVYLPFTSPVHLSAISTPASCIYSNDGINTAYAWGGTPPYAYGWSTGGTTSTISALPTGPYWAHVTDALGCTTYPYYSYVNYDTLGTSCYCTIDGTIYHDINNNCAQDPGEHGIPNIQVHISGTPLNVYVYTDSNGYYSYKVPSGSYTVSETVLSYYPLASCQLNDFHVTSVAGTGCVNTVNFANAIDTIHDMHISTWNYNDNHPIVGHSYSQVTIVSNDGTVPEDSIHVGYRTDGQLYAPTFVPAGYFSGSSYMYNTDSFTTLAPGGTKQFFMNYTVPTNIPIGTNVVFKDTVIYKDSTSWTADYSPWNNVNYFTTDVLASFDPNFKEVMPKGTGAAGIISYTDSVLEYMVHFQNTGSYMAENIVVIDTLDDNLNWTSLRPVYASSQCQVSLTQNGSRKIAKFTFNNINLPTQASDDVRSNGMFTYTIHIKPTLAVGTTIRNHASIYFDYNAPVLTNSTLNTIGTANPNNGVSVKNVTPVSQSTFTIYPNPASKIVKAVISSDVAGSAQMNISDITGRTMITKIMNLQNGTQTIPVDVSQLAPGSYFVSFIQDGRTQTAKLVIMK